MHTGTTVKTGIWYRNECICSDNVYSQRSMDDNWLDCARKREIYVDGEICLCAGATLKANALILVLYIILINI